MLFRQIIHEDLGCASYLVADRESGRRRRRRPAVGRRALPAPGAPARGADRARAGDPQPRRPRLRARAAGADDRGDDPHPRAGRGRVRARALRRRLGAGAGRPHGSRRSTRPGHRPEHTSFLLRDASRGGAPWALLGGDSLFIGDVARPDLAVEPREGAAEMFRSLHERLLTLDDEVEVWPGHLGGSLCGGSGIDLKTSSTIGFERRHNRALGDRRRGRVRRGRGRLARRPAAQRRADRRPQPRPAGRGLRHAGAADPARGRGGGRRRRRA